MFFEKMHGRKVMFLMFKIIEKLYSLRPETIVHFEYYVFLTYLGLVDHFLVKIDIFSLVANILE